MKYLLVALLILAGCSSKPQYTDEQQQFIELMKQHADDPEGITITYWKKEDANYYTGRVRCRSIRGDVQNDNFQAVYHQGKIDRIGFNRVHEVFNRLK